MILIGTSIESAIVSGSTTNFGIQVAKYISAMPFISLTNNLLKYGLDELKLRFRTRLTKFLYTKYLKYNLENLLLFNLINKVCDVDYRNLTYYKMNNLDNRIANVDQLLTQDVEKFCNTLTELYSNLSKVYLLFGPLILST